MKDFIKSLLGNGGYSSKRFWGGTITAMLCISYVYCTCKQIKMVSETDEFMMLAAYLLGIKTIFGKAKDGNA